MYVAPGTGPVVRVADLEAGSATLHRGEDLTDDTPTFQGTVAPM